MARAIPDGYHTITPYLTVPDGERILCFLMDVFGAELRERHKRPDGCFWQLGLAHFGSLIWPTPWNVEG